MKFSLDPVRISRALGYVAGGGLTAVFALGGPKWTAAGPAVMAIAGLLDTIAPRPATAIVQDAAVTTPTGSPTGATNVSTSSDLLPANAPNMVSVEPVPAPGTMAAVPKNLQ